MITSYNFTLNPIQDGFFGAAHGWVGGGGWWGRAGGGGGGGGGQKGSPPS